MGYEREGPHTHFDTRNIIVAWVVYIVLLLGAAIVSDGLVFTRGQVGNDFTSERARGGEQFDSLLNRHFPDHHQIAADSSQSLPLSK